MCNLAFNTCHFPPETAQYGLFLPNQFAKIVHIIIKNE